MNAQEILRVLEITDKHDACDDIWWRTDDEYAPVTFLVTCNDLFFWGCSDAEEISSDTLNEFEKTYDELAEYGFDELLLAPMLFCCRVRSMRPQGAYYSYIPKTIWKLFNACGEKREIDSGNPCNPGEVSMGTNKKD